MEGCDPEMVILHSGINDVSKLGEIAVDHVIKSFKLNARKIARKSKGICAVSGLIQTKDAEKNKLVARINSELQETANECGWKFVSNDAVQRFDLRDEVWK